MTKSNEITLSAIDTLVSHRERLEKELSLAIIGQKSAVENVLLTIFCGGHALIIGVPGLAKTLLVRSLAKCLALSFSRIQFTPDLMPSDITGTEVIEVDPVSGKRRQAFLKGPVFASVVLADEINRTPPKTQAAMLQTMEEREVTVGSNTYSLPRVFHVFATQNPLEMEGTYVLPEAQADRFMFSIHCTYPTTAEEKAVVRSTTGIEKSELKPVLTEDEIIQIQNIVRAIPVSDEVIHYAVLLASRTRPEDPAAPAYIKEFVRWGASPRASQYLILGAKARAALAGKICADYEGVRSVAHEVLRHRIVTNFHARAQKISATEIIDKLLKDIPTH